MSGPRRLGRPSAGGALAGAGLTTMPGRTRCTPSTTTVSPSFRPEAITAVAGVLWPSWIRRCSTLLPSPTTQT